MSDRPNFLLFCTDEMQSFSMGCNGNPIVQTPNIDALANEGVTFRRAYCNNSVCMPSRASMVTGLTPRQHGLLTNGCCLPENAPTITQALVDAGYRTHAVGKLHLQPFGGMVKERHGFSYERRDAWESGEITSLPSPYYGFQSTDFVGGHVNYTFGDYRTWLDSVAPGAWKQFRLDQAYHTVGEGARIDAPIELHHNEYIADRTIDYLGAAGSDQPFFLFCSFPDPHFPYAACKPYSEMYPPEEMPLPETYEQLEDNCDFLNVCRAGSRWAERLPEAEVREIISQTYGMITHIDTCIGRILKVLEDAGQAENTIIGLVADHGEYLGAHNLLHKGLWPLEELERVPFVWRVPGNTPTSHTSDDIVSLLDIVPTVCDYAGLPEDWHVTRGVYHGDPLPLPGRSLRPHFEGTAVDPGVALLEYDEDWSENGPPNRMRGIVDSRYKLIVWAGQEEGLLIDLVNDPRETTNLWNAPSHAEVKLELMTKLVRRLAETDRFDTRRISGA